MIRIFLPCWGETHINLLKKALAKSLLWTGNEICGAEWIVITNENDNKIVSAIKEIDKSSIIKLFVTILLYE